MSTTAIVETQLASQPVESAIDEIQQLTQLLSGSEVITPSDPAYEAESKTWSAGKNLHPKLVVRPNSVESVAKIVKFLKKSSLDFNVRNR